MLFYIIPIITLIIIFLMMNKTCLYPIEYIFNIISSVILSAVVSFVTLSILILIIGCAEPKTYQAETVTTYNISTVNYYQGENEPYYSFSYQTDRGIATKTIEADKTYIQNTLDTPYVTKNKVRFENSTLNFLFGACSTEYTIYIPDDSFIQENYQINLE